MTIDKTKEAKELAARLWDAYAQQRSIENRNRLAEHYLPLVGLWADRYRVKLPHSVDRDDLATSGYFGLLDAIEGFDLGRNVRFETYAPPRIFGAMADGLREMDWAPRLVRSRIQTLESVSKGLTKKLGRMPSKDELIEELKAAGHKDADKIVRDADLTTTISLSHKWSTRESGKDLCEIDTLQDEVAAERLRLEERREFFDWVCVPMNHREKLIIKLLYLQGLTMKETSRAIGISESRISQVHANLLPRIKARLMEQGGSCPSGSVLAS